MFVFQKHFWAPGWGFQGMRISSAVKGIRKKEKEKKPQKSSFLCKQWETDCSQPKAAFVSLRDCLWSNPSEQKLILLPLNRGILAEPLKG